ncbi:hypothetical protein CICLE_v10030320mg, partial [Citrus x clementina]
LERLSRLNNLKFLFLDDNYFNNSIFSSLGGLSSLRHLSLAVNRLNGSDDIKGLNSLSNLEELDMTGNAIENLVVPKELHNFTNLEELILGKSDLHVSQLLPSIASFTSLKYLSMGGCILTGAVHGQDFRKFKNLENLDMNLVYVDVNTSFLQIVGESMPSLKFLSLTDSILNKNTILDQG